MLIHDNARIVISGQACPVKLDADGMCVVAGSLSHELWTGAAQITLADGAMLTVQTENVSAASWMGDNSRYEPFGKFGAIAIVIFILIAGAVFPISFQLKEFKRAWHKLKLAPTKSSQ